MKEYSLSQQFAIVGLDGLVSNHPSIAKKAAVRGICAAKVLEEHFRGNENVDLSEMRQVLQEEVHRIKSYGKKKLEETEREMAALLEADGGVEIVPDLLGCDMNYYTAGISITAYRSDRKQYLGITERVKAEILEEGEVTEECICLLWLFRETGCMHDIFSVKEQEFIQQRVADIATAKEDIRIIWEEEFHTKLENTVVNFLKAKHNLFKNPYMQGVNLVFPFLDRRQAIFVDFVIFGTSVQNRRLAMMEFLQEKGHYVEEVKNGTETLLRIDNALYRIWPKVKTAYRVPIQGADLLPVYR